MIDRLYTERMIQCEPNVLLFESQGMGLCVHATKNTIDNFKTVSYLLVHTVVRENEPWRLYGFLSREERGLFLEIMGTDGIGHRLAFLLMNAKTISEIKRAVFDRRPEDLRCVGIGPKLAAKIISKLSDSFVEPGAAAATAKKEVLPSQYEMAIGALVSLGVKKTEANEKILAVFKDNPEETDSGVIVGMALRQGK